MDDEKIIELFFSRVEDAISETERKYGKLCLRIAQNILANHEDSEECVNDTYYALWNEIPPQRPGYFSAFVGRITRNLSLKKFAYLTAQKRNPEAVCSLNELDECVSGKESVEDEAENRRIQETINRFLWEQEKIKRDVFVLRYWYFEPVKSICLRTGFGEAKVTSMLYHLRQELRVCLEREGIEL